MNKWIVRDYEYEDGPLEGEVRNPEKNLSVFGGAALIPMIFH